MVNIGQLIKEELEKQGRSAGWLAKELHCNRSTVYRALGRNSIDTACLQTSRRRCTRTSSKSFLTTFKKSGKN